MAFPRDLLRFQGVLSGDIASPSGDSPCLRFLVHWNSKEKQVSVSTEHDEDRIPDEVNASLFPHNQ